MSKRHRITELNDFADGTEAEREILMKKWIDLHFYCGCGLGLLATALEIIFYFVIQKLGFLDITPGVYWIRYVLIPSVLNFSGILLMWVVRRYMKRLWSQACAVSILLVFINFVVYTVHFQCSSLCIGFALAILLTTIYGDWRLSSITAAAAASLKIISDLAVGWNRAYTGDWRVDAGAILNFTVSLIGMGITYIVCLFLIRVEREKHAMSMRLEGETLRLHEETMTDALTGSRNRNALRISFNRMLQDRSGSLYTFVMLDMDHFKGLNDTYGHMVGDQYLQELAAILDQVPDAEAFRFGGDEFCLLFRGCTKQQVEQRCRTAQEMFQNCRACREHRPTTISLGAAHHRPLLAPSDLVQRADRALYQAKQNRGSICFYEDMEMETEP